MSVKRIKLLVNLQTGSTSEGIIPSGIYEAPFSNALRNEIRAKSGTVQVLEVEGEPAPPVDDNSTETVVVPDDVQTTKTKVKKEEKPVKKKKVSKKKKKVPVKDN